MANKYELRYLPIFYLDLEDKIMYIKDTLQNTIAANQLLNDVEDAILERLPFAECFEKYESIRERKNTYYRIYVGNYIIFYVVIKEDNRSIMEVRRFLHNKEDYYSVL